MDSGFNFKPKSIKGKACNKLPEGLYLLPCSFLLLRRPYCNPNQFWSFNQNSNGLKFPGFWKSWKNIWMKLDFFPGFPGSWKFWTKLQKNFIWSWVVKDIMISCERAPQNTLCAKKWEKSIRGKIVYRQAKKVSEFPAKKHWLME